jgi:plasmid stabilization system protein ParE
VEGKYRVSITRIAEDDITNISKYISNDNPRSAENWRTEIRSQIASLKQFPARGSIIPEADEIGIDYRHIIYGDYRTIYKIADKEVYIMRVFHSSKLLDLGIFGK